QDFDRERQAFFTAVAHRARHPITVVTGVAELLREQWQRMDPTTIDELVARLSSNASRLGQLVEEVTEAEALSRQARGVIRRPVDLRRVVEEQLRAVLPPVRQVHVHVPTGCMVVADRRLREIALRALLDNAVRHTPDDVSVWVRCEEGADGSLITVDDNGPGIAPADRERIFSPFTSMDSDEHDPSIGLGLYILSEIAAVHGGRAW